LDSSELTRFFINCDDDDKQLSNVILFIDDLQNTTDICGCRKKRGDQGILWMDLSSLLLVFFEFSSTSVIFRLFYFQDKIRKSGILDMI
jgi:hypothetical protein